MADFSALKTSIQNYIKQNGNEEITGNLLQQILLSMVTTLGDSAINDLVTALNAEIANRGNADTTLQGNINSEATTRANADTELGGRITTLQGVVNGIKSNVENGYVYAGIATPSTTPVSGKVFYLALNAGTYTNFGATVVSQGINILKYNGSAWLLDSFLGLDDTPTQGSNNLVKSGGVLDSIIKDGSAFDLSAYNSGATYADLSAALTALNALPAVYKKGGMSMKFVQSSDNNYVQYRLTTNYFSILSKNWQGVDEEPAAGSKNLVESGGVFKSLVGIGSLEIGRINGATGEIYPATQYSRAFTDIIRKDSLIFVNEPYFIIQILGYNNGAFVRQLYYDASNTANKAYRYDYQSDTTIDSIRISVASVDGSNLDLNSEIFKSSNQVIKEVDENAKDLITSIKNNIDNGYVYAGIATPSITPVSGKVFYLALTAGTYTNFGNTTVTQGINILKYNGSAWSLDAFINIDDEPTAGSGDLMKSGGVFKELNGIENLTLGRINGSTGEIYPADTDSRCYSNIIDKNSWLKTSNEYFIIQILGYNAGTFVRQLYYNSTNTANKEYKYQYNDDETIDGIRIAIASVDGGNLDLKNAILIPTSNKFVELSKEIKELKDDPIKLNDVKGIIPTAVHYGKRYYNLELVNALTYVGCDPIDVIGGETLQFTGEVRQYVYAIQFTDKNNNIVGKVPASNNSTYVYNKQLITVPSDAVKAYISCYCDPATPERLQEVFEILRPNGYVYSCAELDKKIIRNWANKKVVWFGTSIPAGKTPQSDITIGKAYPVLVGRKLGANVYNEAVGESSIAFLGFSGTYSNVYKKMMFTASEELALFNALFEINDTNHTISNKGTLAGGKYSVTFTIDGVSYTVTDIPTVTNYTEGTNIRYTFVSQSYEVKLVSRHLIKDTTDNTQYLQSILGVDMYNQLVSVENRPLTYQGTQETDLFVFDHGHNDPNNQSALDVDANSDNRKTFIGGFNIMVRAIMRYRPSARIVVITDYDDYYDGQNYSCELALKVADYWHFPCIDLRKYLPFNINEKVPISGYWDSDKIWHDDGFEWSDNGETYTTNASFNSRFGHSLSDVQAAINPRQLNGKWVYDYYPRWIWIYDTIHPANNNSNEALNMYIEVLAAFLERI